MKASGSGLLAGLRASGPGAKIEEAFLRATGERKRPDADAASVASRRIAGALRADGGDARRAGAVERSAFADGRGRRRVGLDSLARRRATRSSWTDRGTRYCTARSGFPSVVPDRDFVWDQVALRLPTGSVLIAGKSVDVFGEDEVVPVSKGHVRGAVLTSGYYVAPESAAEGRGSKIAFVVQADPKGSLPAWVVNFVAPKQAHNVTRLRKFLDGR